MTDSDYGMCAV